MDALAAALGRSPELFPHSYDVGADSVSFIRLSEDNYRRASFLDARILGRQSVGGAGGLPPPPGPPGGPRGGRSRPERAPLFLSHPGPPGPPLFPRPRAAARRVLSTGEPMILR